MVDGRMRGQVAGEWKERGTSFKKKIAVVLLEAVTRLSKRVAVNSKRGNAASRAAKRG